MRRLTNKELEIMTIFWHHPGGMFVKDMHELYAEPRPHINTISSQVRTLDVPKDFCVIGVSGKKVISNIQFDENAEQLYCYEFEME